MMVEHRSASSWTLLNVVVLLFKAAEAKEDDIVQKYQVLALLWSTVSKHSHQWCVHTTFASLEIPGRTLAFRGWRNRVYGSRDGIGL